MKVASIICFVGLFYFSIFFVDFFFSPPEHTILVFPFLLGMTSAAIFVVKTTGHIASLVRFLSK